MVFRHRTNSSTNLHPPQFSAIRKLMLREPVDADYISTLLSQGLFPKLDSLTLCVPTYDYRHGNAVLYEASWSNVCSIALGDQHQLQFFCLNSDFEAQSSSEEAKMSLEDLFASVRVHRLAALWISASKLLKPQTPTSIDRLCTTFPPLTELYIDLDDAAFISFDDVTELARRLPLLSALDIGIDGTELADPPTAPILSHRLSELKIHKADIVDPFLYAHYVGRLFPFCTIDESALSPDGDSVVSALKLVRKCRKDQEVRCSQEQPGSGSGITINMN